MEGIEGCLEVPENETDLACQEHLQRRENARESLQDHEEVHQIYAGRTHKTSTL